VTPATIPADGEVTITCKITNTGKRAGDEVAQLYFRDVVSSVTTYELNLAGFERVVLALGESRQVQFKLPSRDLVLIDRSGRRAVEPGEFAVHVGASSADLRLHGKFEVSAR
jgi:beta-glucosidase